MSSHHPNQQQTILVCFNVQLRMLCFAGLPAIGVISNLQNGWPSIAHPTLHRRFAVWRGTWIRTSELQIYHPLQEIPLPVCHPFCWISTRFSVVLWLKKRCFNCSLSTDLHFLLRISFLLFFQLGCTKARFPSTSTEHSFLVPALLFMRISHLKFCSQDPRHSPSPALCMKHNWFYGMRSAFASGCIAWAADGKDT